jgi:RHS repeat-associated protein
VSTEPGQLQSSTKDETYAYDPSGNRTSANDGTSLTFSYTADGQLATVGSDTVLYDPAGRMLEIPDGTGSGWRAMAYDGEGRLTELCDWVCSSGSDRLYFTYDAEGRRTRIATAAGGSSSTTELRYLGSAISQEWVDGVLTRQYVTDPDGTVVKLIIAAGQPDAGSYLVNWNGHGDALNLVRILGDGGLEVANSYTYGTWGTPTTHLHATYGDLKFRFLYVGRDGVQWDAAAQLYLMGARHYSPRLGRFIQPDPAALEENPYGYAGNSPVTNGDPDGKLFQRLASQGGGGNVPYLKPIRYTFLKPRTVIKPRVPVPPKYQPPRTYVGRPIATPPTLRGGGAGGGFAPGGWACGTPLRRVGCAVLLAGGTKWLIDRANPRNPRP